MISQGQGGKAREVRLDMPEALTLISELTGLTKAWKQHQVEQDRREADLRWERAREEMATERHRPWSDVNGEAPEESESG